MAEKWEISDDGRVYTFHLRKNAKWSNGEPVTADDYLYSIRRLLDPLTASRYSYQAWYIVNAKKYTLGGGQLSPGDPVEVELVPPADAANTVRGELLHGKLVRSGNQRRRKRKMRQRPVAIGCMSSKSTARSGGSRRPPKDYPLKSGSERCRQVLLDFREVGVKVIDDHTLEIRLTNPTPYFLDLTAFHALSPVNQKCVEKYGSPELDAAGQYRDQWGVSPGRAAAARSDSARAQRHLLGSRKRASSTSSMHFRSTIARRRLTCT